LDDVPAVGPKQNEDRTTGISSAGGCSSFTGGLMPLVGPIGIGKNDCLWRYRNLPVRGSSSGGVARIQNHSGVRRVEVSMTRWVFVPIFALFSVLGASTVALAQMTIDVSKITCDQFLAGKVQDSRSVTVWLSGYYHGLHNNTVLDVNALQQDSQAVMYYCISHPNVILMDAVTTLFEKK
jgi:acid stress chaperone HdeB